MTTVKPSAASLSATAAPIPRDAPVTIATLLVWLVILSLLIVLQSVSDGRKLGSFIFRIIRHYPASQSANANNPMDRFDAMRVFARVVERRSFTLAAEDLGLPRSPVTDAGKQ